MFIIFINFKLIILSIVITCSIIKKIDNYYMFAMFLIC